MIVIAIIGILAAIAIPQFAAYRTKSYNSASQADLRNVKTTLEAFYADQQEYPQ
jgi:type IV pilus assembly protein PilA